jgi:hypothetical protein
LRNKFQNAGDDSSPPYTTLAACHCAIENELLTINLCFRETVWIANTTNSAKGLSSVFSAEMQQKRRRPIARKIWQ